MNNISPWQYFKKRWLLYLSYLFIYVFPLVIIIEKLITIKSNNKVVSVSFVGFVVGIVYIFFVAKKIKAAIKDMKPSAIKIFIHNLLGIIPFATVGFLVVLVEKALRNSANAIWFICISMLIGAILQTVEYAKNRKFLYKLHIDELAREKVDVARREKELMEELENE
jgi:uncharacterized membrane protein YjfL (UPF0719 family)